MCCVGLCCVVYKCTCNVWRGYLEYWYILDRNRVIPCHVMSTKVGMNPKHAQLEFYKLRPTPANNNIGNGCSVLQRNANEKA
mmetsp:Transcript_17404/g.38113  ORF Transcript_17404/g.38113 Transcript_17404/m.38113 type:complete len:82 (-) Transcript_17404:17-262(-)